MKTFKSLAEFKRVLQINDKLNCTRHLYNPGVYPPREVSIKHTDSFALKTKKSNGQIVDSWCYYPKAKDCKVENNQLIILQNGEPYLTYSFAE